jgi:hypothetical protein
VFLPKCSVANTRSVWSVMAIGGLSADVVGHWARLSGVVYTLSGAHLWVVWLNEIYVQLDFFWTLSRAFVGYNPCLAYSSAAGAQRVATLGLGHSYWPALDASLLCALAFFEKGYLLLI